MRASIFLFVFLVGCCIPPHNTGETTPTGTSLIPDYDRSEWGRWKDLDGDCQDARQEVLIAESTEPVTLDEKGCRVLSGAWKCPFTGNAVTDPSLLDIDHVVALREAHYAGGFVWSKERKLAYFNDLEDPGHLMAVDRSANRSKGSRGPDEWMPQVGRCEYLKARAQILSRWKLDYDCELYLRLMSEHCGGAR